jgi:hypothetical protein
MAVIADDPDILMKGAVVNNNSTVVPTTGVTAANIGENIGYFVKANTGTWVDGVNAATGNSGTGIDLNTIGTAVTLPLRIVDVVAESAVTTGYSEVLVAFNPPYQTAVFTGTAHTSPIGGTIAMTAAGGHQYRNPTGL